MRARKNHGYFNLGLYKPTLGTKEGGRSPKSERLKEEIGWLKVVFAVAVALDASLVAWLAQNYDTSSTLLFVAGVVAAVVLAFVVAYVNRLAYRRLKELEDA